MPEYYCPNCTTHTHTLDEACRLHDAIHCRGSIQRRVIPYLELEMFTGSSAMQNSQTTGAGLTVTTPYCSLTALKTTREDIPLVKTMSSFQHYPDPLNHHLATPSSSESVPLRGEGIWRQASHSNLEPEMFGQAPGTPTPFNVSPLYSGSSSGRTIPPHGSLLLPHDHLRASSRSQLSLPLSSTTMRSATPTTSQPVQSGFPPWTEHKCLPPDTAHHHQAQSEDTGRASGGRTVGLWGRLSKFFRVSFHALLCIPIQPTPELPEHTPSVSLKYFIPHPSCDT